MGRQRIINYQKKDIFHNCRDAIKKQMPCNIFSIHNNYYIKSISRQTKQILMTRLNQANVMRNSQLFQRHRVHGILSLRPALYSPNDKKVLGKSHDSRKVHPLPSSSPSLPSPPPPPPPYFNIHHITEFT